MSKIIIKCKYFFIFIFFLIAFSASAQPGGGGPPPPPVCFPPPCVPIDGGIGFLVAAGVLITLKKGKDLYKS